MTVEATNCHRAYASKGQSLAASFHSEVIDFKDMPNGSIQARWEGATGTLNGEFKIYASNYPETSTFDGNELACATIVVNSAAKAPIWIREGLGFRYAQVRYIPNGVTGGSCEIIAIGKK